MRLPRLPAPAGVLAFERGTGTRVALNFTDAPQTVRLEGGAVTGGLSTVPGRVFPTDATEISLAPDEGIVLLNLGDGL